MDSATNPVQKVGLAVCRYEDYLFIDDLVVDGDLVESAADDEMHASGDTNANTFDLNLKRKWHSSQL